ncbi:MAG: hypothetical protein WDN50_12945 [Bradyrhizobium sp.]
MLEPIECPAPAIIDRDLVIQPVQTGLVVVDTLFALGRGQRELIIGDRAVGRRRSRSTRLSLRKTSDIVCVYVAVGQKSSSVRRAVDAIQKSGALERCIIVGCRICKFSRPAMDCTLCRIYDGRIFPRPRPACAGRG